MRTTKVNLAELKRRKGEQEVRRLANRFSRALRLGKVVMAGGGHVHELEVEQVGYRDGHECEEKECGRRGRVFWTSRFEPSALNLRIGKVVMSPFRCIVCMLARMTRVGDVERRSHDGR